MFDIDITMDPKFAEAIRRSRLEGEEMRKREYLESCDRGAKEIQQLFESEHYQKEALRFAQLGYKKYCTVADNAVYNCLTSKDHRECSEAKKKVFLEGESLHNWRYRMVCYHFPK